MSEEPTMLGGRRGPTDAELKAAMPKDRGRHEVRTGIFVLAGLLAVVASLFLLTDPATLRGRYILVTRVDDAGGIRKGDPILLKGVNIGRVHSFNMAETGQVDIQMEIDGQWKLPVDSRTRLAGAGLLGGSTMEILRGTSDQLVESMDTLRGAAGGGGIMESATAVASHADTVLSRIQETLNRGTVTAIQGSAADLQRAMVDMRALAATQRAQLATLTASLNRTASGFEPTGAQAQRVIAHADSAAIVMNQTSVKLDRAASSLEEVLGRINSGQGTLGRLSKDDSLYESLNRAATEIGNLAADFRANPKKYVDIRIF
jgi:phospholipid/cholesterol/gamma-HCH transport system substrate-binding protein